MVGLLGSVDAGTAGERAGVNGPVRGGKRARVSLQFYEKSHRYKLDGRWIPGVTTLIKGGLPNDALKYWAAKYVAEWVADHPEFTEEVNRLGGRSPTVAFLKALPWQKRDVASERGTEVHAYARSEEH